MASSWLLNTYHNMKLIYYAILIYPSHFRNDEHMFSPTLCSILIVSYEKIRLLDFMITPILIIIIILCLYSYFDLRKITRLNNKLDQRLFYKYLYLKV